MSEAAIEVVTPETARRWLEANTNNRELSTAQAEGLTRAMQRGEWGFSWDAIAFAQDGRLLNGQHRLVAVARSGIMQTFVVVRGVDPGATVWSDSGKRRDLSNHLQMAGSVEWRNLAPVVKWFWNYARYGSFAAPKVAPTDAELMATYRRHDMLPSLRKARNWSGKGRRSPLPVTATTTLHYILSQTGDPADADVFFEAVASATGLEEGDPRLTLRRQLERSRLRKAQGGYDPPAHVKAAWVVKAWNAWQEGAQPQGFRYRPGSGEHFPPIAGVDREMLDIELSAQSEPPLPPRKDQILGEALGGGA